MRARVYYGPGLEFLERVWPMQKSPGLSLWMSWGTTYGVLEDAVLRKALSQQGAFSYMLVAEAFDDWVVPSAASELANHFTKRKIGQGWLLYERIAPRTVVSIRPLEFLAAFGGNVDSTQLNSAMELQHLNDGRSFLGLAHGSGEILLAAPSYRAGGEVVLRRIPGRNAPSAAVQFAVFAVQGNKLYPRWSADVSLPADQTEVVMPFTVDSSGLPLRFFVSIPSSLGESVFAGWRGLRLTHSQDGPEVPPKLLPDAEDAVPAGAAQRGALLPAGWDPPQVFVRNAKLGDQGLELSSGGEIWIRLTGLFAEIAGVASVRDGVALPAQPVVSVIFYKGARIDVLSQAALRESNRRFAFKAWSAEADGWLVILSHNQSVPPVSVRILSARAR
jgi:hypothetical protein